MAVKGKNAQPLPNPLMEGLEICAELERVIERRQPSKEAAKFALKYFTGFIEKGYKPGAATGRTPTRRP